VRRCLGSRVHIRRDRISPFRARRVSQRRPAPRYARPRRSRARVRVPRSSERTFGSGSAVRFLVAIHNVDHRVEVGACSLRASIPRTRSCGSSPLLFSGRTRRARMHLSQSTPLVTRSAAGAPGRISSLARRPMTVPSRRANRMWRLLKAWVQKPEQARSRSTATVASLGGACLLNARSRDIGLPARVDS
jgi:hypothetical protein